MDSVRSNSRWRTYLSTLAGGQRLLLATAVLVGLGAGLGAIVFRWLIERVRQLSFESLPELVGQNGVYLILAPALGGLIVGPLIYFFAREAKGHGVPEVMAAVALRGGRIRPVVAVVKSLASSLTIGSGGAVGREGPIVQIGSTLGSTVGQALKLSDERIRNLVACGAAGGIAATFNAPIAGVFFALEVILGDFSVGAFGTVVVSSVTASVVGRAAFGDVPAFRIPEYIIHSLWELPMYFGLGLVAAVVAVAYTRSVYAAEDTFEKWKVVPDWLKPAIGGALLGLLALLYGRVPGLAFEHVPQVYGVGYETIEAGLLGSETLLVMLALLALKILATSITLGSGGSGGVFAPGLFIGFGIVSLTDVRDATNRDDEEPLCVRDLMASSLIVAYPDDTLGEVLRRIGPRDLSRLPVVAREDSQRLLGVVRRNDIVRAYNLALTRRSRDGLEVAEQLRSTGPVSFVEVELVPGAACVGRTVARMSRKLPAESLLVSIRRVSGEFVFPHGDTVFESGDTVLASVRTEREDDLRRALTG